MTIQAITDLKTHHSLRELHLESKYLIGYGHLVSQSTILSMGKDIHWSNLQEENRLSYQHVVHPWEDIVNQISTNNEKLITHNERYDVTNQISLRLSHVFETDCPSLHSPKANLAPHIYNECENY